MSKNIRRDYSGGQYYGGPGAVAKYMWRHNTIFVSTDPVAADSVDYDVILDRQIENGIIEPSERQAIVEKHNLLALAENLGLGIHRGGPIELRRAALGRSL